MDTVEQLFDYCTIHPSMKIRNRKSIMILNIHSDASYLGVSKAKSCTAGYFFLGWLPQDKQPIKSNGPIQVLTFLLHFVAASASQGELGGLIVNAREKKNSVSFLTKWDTPNHPLQLTAIIPLLLEFQMTLSRNNALYPWKRLIFGLNIKYQVAQQNCCSLAPCSRYY